jgi:hypothetical protein
MIKYIFTINKKKFDGMNKAAEFMKCSRNLLLARMMNKTSGTFYHKTFKIEFEENPDFNESKIRSRARADAPRKHKKEREYTTITPVSVTVTPYQLGNMTLLLHHRNGTLINTSAI